MNNCEPSVKLSRVERLSSRANKVRAREKQVFFSFFLGVKKRLSLALL